MLGTLNLSAGSSLKFSPETARSDREMPFSTRRSMICYAAVAEATPEVERRKMMMRRRKESSSSSLYEVLRVKQDASPGEIKTAYRTLAKLYHPDASAAAMEAALDGKEFIEIHEAYSTLSDPAERAKYDMALSVGSRARRRVMRYHTPDSRAGFYTTRRWETDQCW